MSQHLDDIFEAPVRGDGIIGDVPIDEPDDETADDQGDDPADEAREDEPAE